MFNWDIEIYRTQCIIKNIWYALKLCILVHIKYKDLSSCKSRIKQSDKRFCSNLIKVGDPSLLLLAALQIYQSKFIAY
jgi:hypothetical protein